MRSFSWGMGKRSCLSHPSAPGPSSYLISWIRPLGPLVPPLWTHILFMHSEFAMALQGPLGISIVHYRGESLAPKLKRTGTTPPPVHETLRWKLGGRQREILTVPQ